MKGLCSWRHPFGMLCILPPDHLGPHNFYVCAGGRWNKPCELPIGHRGAHMVPLITMLTPPNAPPAKVQ